MFNGKRCKKCGSIKSAIYDSRQINNKTIRHRKCLDCGAKWETIEVYYWDLKGLEK